MLEIYARSPLAYFFEHALARSASGPTNEAQADLSRGVMASYSEFVRLLGSRTAQMHLALASRPEDPVFSRNRIPISIVRACITVSWPVLDAPWRSSATCCPGCRKLYA